MDGEKVTDQGFQKKVKKIKDFRRRDKKSRISEGIKNQGFLTKVRKNNGCEKKVKKIKDFRRKKEK